MTQRQNGNSNRNGAHSPRRILVVEDDRGLTQVVERSLTRIGFDIESVYSGAEAVERILENPPDLMILDYSLSDMTGEQIVNSLADKGRNVPFIVITGQGDEQVAVAMMKLGAREYLVKDTTFLERLPHVVKIVTEQITTEKRLRETEEALHESEKRYRTLFESNADGMIVVDNDQRILLANRAFSDILGFDSPEELVGINILDYIPEESGCILDMMNEGVDWDDLRNDNEFRARNKSGKEIWVSILGVHSEYQDQTVSVVSIRDITNRKQVADRLRFLSSIAEQMAESVVLTDTDFRIIYVNKAFEKLYGYSYDELTGKTLDVFQTKPDVENIQHNIYRDLTSGMSISGISQNKRKDGSTFTCDFRISPFHDKQEKIVSYIVLQRDVTEQRQTEILYRTLTQSSPISIYIVQDGKFVFVNPQFLADTGYSEEELLGSNPLDMVHPDDLNSVQQNAIDMLKGGRLTPYEFQMFGNGGRLEWCIETVTSIQYQGKRASMGTFILITERKKMEAAVLLAERNFRSSLDDSPMGIRIVSHKGDLLYANQAILDIYGYESIEELRNTPVRARYIPKSYAEHNNRKKLRKQLKPTPENYEIGILRKDGAVRWLSVSRKEVVWDGEQNSQVLYQDITERKQAEEELKRSHEELRNMSAAARTATESERTSIARDIHDGLGQALTALKMDIAWLGKKLPEDQEKLLEKTSGMNALINEAIQTVQSVSTRLRPGVLDDLGITAALEWQGEEFQKRSGVNLTMKVKPDEITVDSEIATEVFRIFQEALTNIGRHAEASQVRVSLLDDNDKLVLQVRDNGVGITREQITSSGSFGLIGMRERALFSGGTIDIRRARRGGTVVTLEVPHSRQGDKA